MKHLLVFLTLLLACNGYCQEWKNMKTYKKATNKDHLPNGNWLKKDRKHNTRRWATANEFNLSRKEGSSLYTDYAQKRDFYAWFDRRSHNQGHEVKWAGVAYIITKKLCYLDYWVIRKLVVGNKAFIHFTEQSNNLILKNIYPDLARLDKMKPVLTGSEAHTWDSAIVYKEQCVVIDTLYAKQPKRVILKFNHMASGNGLYGLFVPKGMRFKGDISDCRNRCNYGLNVMGNYYDQKHR